MFRRDDTEIIEEYAAKYSLSEQAVKALYDLCLKIHASGWCDGSNDIIYDEEE